MTATPRRPGTPAALGGRYRVLECIGSGATADVYRARDERLRRDVAAKVIVQWLVDDAASIHRMHREAELGARLAHRNIAAVLDIGSRPRHHIVFTLAEGRDAGRLLKYGEPPAPALAVEVLVQVCEALAHAHGRGVVHCDVAPGNILVPRRGRVATLVDFGLAVETLHSLPAGLVMGTPGYVAPEVLSGGAPPSPQSDLYALGVVAYRLLGGPPLFRRRGRGGTAAGPTAVPQLPALGDVRPDLPRALVAVVEQAMAADPAARPASALELRDRLLATRVAPLRAAAA